MGGGETEVAAGLDAEIVQSLRHELLPLSAARRLGLAVQSLGQALQRRKYFSFIAISLVELQRGSSLIGRGLRAVTTPAILCHKEATRRWFFIE